MTIFDGQPWAMEPERLESLALRVEKSVELAWAAAKVPGFDARMIANGRTPRAPGERPYELRGDTAVVNVSGVLMPQVPWWLSWLGIDATSTEDLRQAVAAAAEAPDVARIVLRVNSPGGSTTGMVETAAVVREAAKAKPVHAAVDGMAASGAYWIASQAAAISAPADAIVGSIGVYSVLVDSSKEAADRGRRVHVVRSGAHKGVGVPGSPIDPEKLAVEQEIVDGLAKLFQADVQRGRRLGDDQIKSLSTGRAWLGVEAKTLGLVDEQEPLAKALSRLAPCEDTMQFSKETQDAAVAEASKGTIAGERKRLADLKAAFPKNLQFALDQFEAGATVDQAKLAFLPILEKEKDAAEKKAAESQKAAEEAAAKSASVKPAATPPPSAAPLASQPVSDGSGSGKTFMELAKAHAAEAKCSMQKAMSHVCKTNPQAYRAHVHKTTGRYPGSPV